MIHITITTNFNEQICFYEIDKTKTVEDVKSLLQAEVSLLFYELFAIFKKFSSIFKTGVAVASQVLQLGNGGKLDDSKTLEQCGVNEGDVLILSKASSQNPPPNRAQQPRPPAQNRPQGGGAQNPDPETLMEVIRSDPTTIEQLSRSNPPLLEAALAGNLEKFKALLEETTRANSDAQRRERAAQEHERMLANADPFDPEAQAKIAEYIRQKNVEDNFVNAMEVNPEAFARVSMLYIDCKVNGTNLKAFVDSGAQSTIMSEKCAKICNIYHLLDTRYHGMAQGVGTAKILGRIHVANLTIGKTAFVSSFTIMESQPGSQDLDFLLGLDNLKRHQACIDLKQNVLKIGPETVPFLAEKDIPGHEESLRGSIGGLGSSIDVQIDDGSNSNNNAPNTNHVPPNNTSGVGGGFPEETIKSLMELTGQPREKVIDALRMCGGNADLAMQQLSGFGF